VVRLVNQHLEPYLEKELVWKSQADTYVRELERYGYQATGRSETLFCHDSLAAIAILEHTVGGEQENLRWLWGVRSVDELLGAFGYGLPGKQRLIGLLKESFAREFGMNKDLKLQLDAKYRGHKALLSQFLQPGGELAAASPSIAGALAQRNAYAATLAAQVGTPEQQQELGVNPDHLVSSHVHMLLNRLIPANQRLHELVIYDFLSRQYQAQAALQKQ
jgi:thiopeptide-type bacteriocin biosynthesis protein